MDIISHKCPAKQAHMHWKPHLYVDAELPNNCRPVSNLCFAWKILEKVVVSQLYKYIEDNDLMEPLQSAYNKAHNTETALVRVQNNIMCAIAIDQWDGVLLVL